jgi:hypothetical protein
LKVSAIECVVSASIAAEPVSSAATPLATAMSRLAATATTTVRRLAFSGWVTAPLDARATGLGGLDVAGHALQVGDLSGQRIGNRHRLFLDLPLA